MYLCIRTQLVRLQLVLQADHPTIHGTNLQSSDKTVNFLTFTLRTDSLLIAQLEHIRAGKYRAYSRGYAVDR